MISKFKAERSASRDVSGLWPDCFSPSLFTVHGLDMRTVNFCAYLTFRQALLQSISIYMYCRLQTLCTNNCLQQKPLQL